MGFRFTPCTTRLDTSAKRVHQVDNVRRLGPLRPLDRLAFLFLFEQLLERVLILIFKLARLEVALLCLHDMRGKIEHILWEFLIRDVTKVVLFVADLVGILWPVFLLS